MSADPVELREITVQLPFRAADGEPLVVSIRRHSTDTFRLSDGGRIARAAERVGVDLTPGTCRRFDELALRLGATWCAPEFVRTIGREPTRDDIVLFVQLLVGANAVASVSHRRSGW